MLDLGCGLGYLTRYFLNIGIETIGVDISKELINYSKKNVPNGSFVLADGTKLPFKEECFNTIILNDVLEHVPYNLAMPLLYEAKRTMKRGGSLYISVANRYQLREPHTQILFLTWLPRSCWNAIHKRIKKRQIPNYYPYTIKSLKKLCQEVGFSYRDYTWFYAWNKISKTKHIGDPFIKKIVEIIKKFNLSRIAYFIAEKVSVILFICKK